MLTIPHQQLPMKNTSVSIKTYYFFLFLLFSRNAIDSAKEAIRIVHFRNYNQKILFSALLASGFKWIPENDQNVATLLPCSVGTFSNSSTKGVNGCTRCPPGMLWPSTQWVSISYNALGYARFYVSQCFFKFIKTEMQYLGSSNGAVVRALASHQCDPGLISGLAVVCGLSLLLILVLAPRVYSGFFCFSSCTKTNTSKFQFDRKSKGHRFVSRRTIMCYPRKGKSIYLFQVFLFALQYLFSVFFKFAVKAVSTEAPIMSNMKSIK